MKKITPMDLHDKLEAAGIPVHGVAEDGRIDFNDATDEQKAAAAAILKDYDQDVEDARKAVEEAEKPRETVTEEDIDNAKTVADVKVLLKRMLKGK